MRALPKAGKRWLVLGHRWLGIGTALFFLTWLLSGLVIMYVPFPGLTEAERLAALPPVAFAEVAVAPPAAAGALALEMQGDEPVYRLVDPEGGHRTLSARTGAPMPALTEAAALALARARFGAGPEAFVDSVERDQWTVPGRYDPHRPLRRVGLGDAAGTELYFSGPTGALVLETTRRERAWNWLGAVPHWLYPTPLRARPGLWRDVVLWVSGLGIAGAVSGLVLGVWRLRLRRPYRSGSVTPYRGFARWHHLFGLVGGIAILSFVASGWLSMNPNRWFTGPSPTPAMRAGFAGAPGEGPDRAALEAASPPGTVSLRLLRLGGRTRLVATDGAGGRSVTPPVDADAIRAAAPSLMPGAALARIERLAAYDAYWYAHHDARVLPVLRLVFDDPAATWFHVDAATGELLDRLDRSGRVQRWLFAALHRLDLPLLIRHRPAWDLALWSLTALALVVALSGTVLGWRRLRRGRPGRGDPGRGDPGRGDPGRGVPGRGVPGFSASGTPG
ncbi:PepSY domain-containing protein [Methylobacterium planeticum]|uniref:PepSY domain-containing protein n=1 Tax=Methylobacterium planeticum TaxID=2615211 RepID=UPI001FEE71D3|nr:PepSY domain-containing protein [Methylobacterium planeticum]